MKRVRAPHFRTVLLAAFVAVACLAVSLVSASAATTPTARVDGLAQKVVGSTVATGDRTGFFQIAVDGDTMVVGAHLSDLPGANDAGRVLVYVREGDQWVEQAVLTASDPLPNAWFGSGIAIEGDVVVVGAHGYNIGGTANQAGAAYVFTRADGVWTQRARLTAPDYASQDWFGNWLSISGDSILVSAHGDDDRGLTCGAAYVYTGSGDTWTLQAKIVPEDLVSSDFFGKGLQISGDSAIFSAWGDDDRGSSAGAAYIYTRTAGVWTQQQKIYASDAAANDFFGDTSVALDGDVAVVGSRADDDKGNGSGSAYVFTRSGAAWSQEQKLTASDGMGSDEFGRGVAISGDWITIGCPGDDISGAVSADGSAYLFRKSGASWAEARRIVAPDNTGSDTFGYCVAADGDLAVASAYLEDNQRGSDAGSAYVFQNPQGYATEDAVFPLVSTETSPVARLMLNDTDPEGDPLTAELVSDATSGTVALNADGTYTYTPDTDFFGVDSFRYRVTDGVNVSAPATAYVTVKPVNDAPSFVTGPAAVVSDEDIAYSGSWATSISAGPYEPESVSFAVSNDNNALFASQPTIAADGALAYTPAANASGSAVVSVYATDGSLVSATSTFTVTVNPVNDAPSSAVDSGTVVEDGALTVAAPGLLGNDSDVEGDPITAQVAGAPASGTVEVWADGSFTYTPMPDFHGIDSFTYQASDGTTLSVPCTVTIEVTPVNDPPYLDGPDQVLSNEDIPYSAAWPTSLTPGPYETEPVTIALSNDNTALFAVQPTMSPAGTLSYAPAPNSSGTAIVSAVASDGSLESAITTFAITVMPVNDAPAAVPDTATVAEDAALDVDAPGLVGNDTDIENDALSAQVVDQPANGTVTVDADGSYRYQPGPDFYGTDTFTYRASDASTFSAPATVTIEVTPVNDPPSFSAGPDVTREEGSGPQVISWATSISAGPDESEAVTFSVECTNSALFESGPAIAPDGTLTFETAFNTYGTVVATATLQDADGLMSEPETFTIRITRVNEPAALVADEYFIDEDNVLDEAAPGVLANDSDIESDPMTAALVNDVASGDLEFNPDGSFEYTPDVEFSGVDAFSYRVNDTWEDSDPVTVTINVANVNDVPISAPDSYTIDEDRTLSVNFGLGVLANDTDAEKVTLSAEKLSNPAAGSVTSFGADGGFTYVPPANFNGTVEFTYRAGDGNSFSAPETITVHVLPINDAPVAGEDVASATEDRLLSVPAPGLLGNDSDVEGDSLTPTLTVQAANGTVSIAPDGSYTYKPDSNYFGADSFRYAVSDGTTRSAAVLVEIEIAAVNDAPVAVADSASVTMNATLTVDPSAGVLANDTDVEHESLSATLVAAPAHGTLDVRPDGGYTYRPVTGYTGTDSFTYTASDGATSSVPGTVTITVINPDVAGTVTRVSGTDRFAVAVAMARKGWDPKNTKTWSTVDHVIVTNGETGKEADPLSAAGLAGVYDAPVLLVKASGVPASTKTLLTEIAAKKKAAGKQLSVHIVGGTASVPNAVWNQIKAIPGVSQTPDRLAGADRYSVSATIADRIVAEAPKRGKAISGVIVIAADNPAAFYDALAASPIAFAKTMPMLSVKKGSIPPSVASRLNGSLKSKTRYLASGPGYISVAVPGAARLTSSPNRFVAATEIAKFGTAPARGWAKVTDAGIAAKLPDALTGGAFLGKRGGVLLFTESAPSIQATTKSFITANGKAIDFGWVLGGTASVPAGQETSFRNLTR